MRINIRKYDKTLNDEFTLHTGYIFMLMDKSPYFPVTWSEVVTLFRNQAVYIRSYDDKK